MSRFDRIRTNPPNEGSIADENSRVHIRRSTKRRVFGVMKGIALRTTEPNEDTLLAVPQDV